VIARIEHMEHWKTHGEVRGWLCCAWVQLGGNPDECICGDEDCQEPKAEGMGFWTEDEVREIESRAAARSEALAGLVEEGTP